MALICRICHQEFPRHEIVKNRIACITAHANGNGVLLLEEGFDAHGVDPLELSVGQMIRHGGKVVEVDRTHATVRPLSHYGDMTGRKLRKGVLHCKQARRQTVHRAPAKNQGIMEHRAFQAAPRLPPHTAHTAPRTATVIGAPPRPAVTNENDP